MVTMRRIGLVIVIKGWDIRAIRSVISVKAQGKKMTDLLKDTPRDPGRVRTKIAGSSLPASMLFPVHLPHLMTFRVLHSPNFSEPKATG